MEQIALDVTTQSSDRTTCSHIFPMGRHCRQAVPRLGDHYCPAHEPRYRGTLTAMTDNPLDELADELNAASGANEVRSFISKVIRLACQNRISMSRATALTFLANSLLNAIRLANYEQRLADRDNNDDDSFKVDFTGFPRPIRNHPPAEPEAGVAGL